MKSAFLILSAVLFASHVSATEMPSLGDKIQTREEAIHAAEAACGLKTDSRENWSVTFAAGVWHLEADKPEWHKIIIRASDGTPGACLSIEI